MASLRPEIILCVAKHADLDTILALSLTCRSYYNTIHTYEHAIVKDKLRSYHQLIHQPNLPGRKEKAVNQGRKRKLKLSVDELPLTQTHGSVLLSSTPDRRIPQPYTFTVIRELERREARYDDLFCPGGFLEMAIEEVYNPVSREEMTALNDRLRHACRLTDRLGDVVADILVQIGTPDKTGKYINRPPVAYRQDHHTSAAKRASVEAKTRRSLLTSSPTLPSPTSIIGPDEWERRKDAAAASLGLDRLSANVSQIARAVRREQIRLLAQLPLLDLAFLAGLARVIERAFADAYPAPSEEEDDDGMDDGLYFETVTAFKEAVLRYGASSVLWGMCAERFTLGRGPTAAPVVTSVPAREETAGAGEPKGLAAITPPAAPWYWFAREAIDEVLRELEAWEQRGWSQNVKGRRRRSSHEYEGVGEEQGGEGDVASPAWGWQQGWGVGAMPPEATNVHDLLVPQPEGIETLCPPPGLNMSVLTELRVRTGWTRAHQFQLAHRMVVAVVEDGSQILG
ncbi:hypothetical protein VTK73DRAFT_5283 [Phialemonium thermophilum]|uniref:F-box domain-containing protein n=1 Tax=Phialemonium thermophilum TaxID=223376 RepID=A0ABR3WPF7_9PEZI